MTIKLEQNDYGESQIRLLRVTRNDGRHEIKDLEFSIRFEGEFESAYTGGDNRKILPGDSMKNTVHVLAQQYPSEAIEEFALHLTDHFLTYNPQVSRVEISGSERQWARISAGEKPHPSAFVGGSGERRTTRVSATRKETILHSGLEGLSLLKTAGAALLGFLRDPYTTLEATPDGSLAATIQAEWTYEEPDPPFSAIWHGVRKTMLETFAAHDGRSPQHTLYAMGHAVLDNFGAIYDVQLALQEIPLRLVNLKPFGVDSNEEIYESSDVAHTVVRAVLSRRP